MKRNKKLIVVFLTPALLMFVVTFVYPVIRTAIMSFFKIENITSSMSQWKFTGIDNYVKLLNTEIFRISMINLLKIWVYGGLIVMTLALLFAVILSSGVRGKKFFRAVLYLPNIVSAIALAVMWQQYVYSSQIGLFKPIADLGGWQWLDSEHKFLAMLIAYCFGMVGYHMLIFLAGIERISPEYYEAATLDGASKLGQFRYITLPLIKGVFKTNITVWSVFSVGFFVWSQLFAGSGSTVSASLMTPLVYMYSQTFGSADFVSERNAGLGAAIGICMAIFILIVFGLMNRLIKEDKDLEF